MANTPKPRPAPIQLFGGADGFMQEMAAAYTLARAERRAEHGREPMPLPAREMLRAYVAAPEKGISERWTFTYIVSFLETGAVHPRLAVACGDHGYTRTELDELRAKGVRAPEVAAEILARA